MARRKNPGMTQMPFSMPTARPSRYTAMMGRGASDPLGESDITRVQTSFPNTMRAAPGADAGDAVQFVGKSSKIVVEPAIHEAEADPAVTAFPNILEESIHTATAFPVGMMEAMKTLTADVEVDIDALI
jgi:hypothetical protein